MVDNTMYKLILALIAGSVAVFAFLKGIETDFQPQTQTRLLLFVSGFVGMLAMTWLVFPEPFAVDLWLKLLVSTIFGFFWAYTAPKRWRFIQKQSKKSK